MSDFWSMFWKETSDSIFSGHRRELIIPLMIIAIMGIIIPWQFGQQWISLSPAMIFIVTYIPFFLTTNYIGDAIAGERERHTLETLLASRISDQAILWGKISVTIAYVWGLTLIGLTIGLVTSNLLTGNGQWRFYGPLNIFLEMLVMSLLASLLSASSGVLISMRVSTVRQAQQTMAIGSLVLLIVIVLILKAIPAGILALLNTYQLLLFFIGSFTILDIILLWVLSISFRRSRLILM